jgi:hypothetical protein
VTLSQLKKQGPNFERATKIDGSPGLEKRTFEKLDRQEEPFNHQLEIFLRLAPKTLLDSVVTECGLEAFRERPAVLTRTVELVWAGTQLTSCCWRRTER